jgi:hypothetical protein
MGPQRVKMNKKHVLKKGNFSKTSQLSNGGFAYI